MSTNVAAADFVEIDDTTYPLVTFKFLPCEPTEEQLQAYYDRFEHIVTNVASDSNPVVIIFDLRNGTARNPMIAHKQIRFNQKMKVLFATNLAATAILVDSDFYITLIKGVFLIVKKVRPNMVCNEDQQAKAFLKKELAKFKSQKN
jgi:hypothetical protein